MPRKPEPELFPELASDLETTRAGVAPPPGAGEGGSAGDLVEVLALAGFDEALTYRLPPHLVGRVRPGSLVRVPLRHGAKLGVVERLGSAHKLAPGKVKQVLELIFPEPILTPDLLALARWVGAYYLAKVETVLETMIPAPVRAGMAMRMERHVRAGRLALTDDEFAALERRARKQAAAYRFLRAQTASVTRGALLTRLKISSATLDALIEKGLAEEVSRENPRVAYADEWADTETAAATAVGAFELNEPQRAAIADISASLASGKFHPHLLHGVTGSGKTEVYLRAIREALAAGGGVIYLVPEVALTPQTVGRLRSALADLGEEVVVWHSHLTAGERFDAWMAVARGAARVVVGARSAVFAPVANLRLIVVDEEHEPAYKQAEAPRYHGRDVAVYRAKLTGAVCVLGSATPSLESLMNARAGRYKLNLLPERVDGRAMPTMRLVDLRHSLRKGMGPAVLSRELAEGLRDRFEKREQSILFLNRRGYSASLLCPECGYVAQCRHCSVALAYHRIAEQMRCHWCGHAEPAPTRCPQCRAETIRWRGFGTERVEDQAQRVLPRARIVRLDSDTMERRSLFRQILADFRRGKIDVLVGTQMIAKGLDFPNVTLVGLVDADLSLHQSDFRAHERTFQLLVQVSGRAGRGDRAGEVFVKTYTPHSPPIQFARRAGFNGFLDAELAQRREYHYPPSRRLIRHLFRGRNAEKVHLYAEQWARRAEAALKDVAEIRGPAPPQLEKIKDYHRYQLWYFVESIGRIAPRLRALREEFPLDPQVLEAIDVDPVDLS
jgi:primosomal protein N' (replication factor Y) (superfamily II helicase)